MAQKGQKRVHLSNAITITQAQHKKLIDDLTGMLEFADPVRKDQIRKFEAIDREVAGYLKLDEDDRKRKRDTEKGYGPKVYDTSLPLTMTQLDEAITFFMSVIAAEDGLYHAVAPKDKQQVAKAFAALMNEHAETFQHERHLGMFLFDCLKYNFGALCPEWREVYGNKIENTAANQPLVRENTVVSKGNALEWVDPYNFWYDVSVDPTSLYSKGQFFATGEAMTNFRIRKMAQDKLLFNTESVLKESQTVQEWIEKRPQIRTSDQHSSETDWVSILSRGQTKNVIGAGHEVIKFHAWINPKDYGLSPTDQLQIWRLWMVDGKYIVHAQHLNNAHALLPISIGMPWEDGFREQTKSFAEMLMPLQRFASFQMNIHQRAARKSLYGLTVYNSRLNLDEVDDLTAAKIPYNGDPSDDIRKMIAQFRDAPDTANTMQDISNVIELMQKVLPTDILKQVAGLERATQYQAAATVQGANRRNLKIAKLLNVQALAPSRHMQMFNILQYQDEMEILTEEGELQTVNPTDFRDTNLRFTISDGLKGLDKLAIVMNIKEVLNSVLQSQQASQVFDVGQIINYWTSLLGDKTDFSQFRFENEFDKLDPQQKQIAFQLLQRAAAAQQEGQEGVQ